MVKKSKATSRKLKINKSVGSSQLLAAKRVKRTAVIERNTNETKIKVLVNLDGSGKSKISTGIGFFDHMLELFAKRALMDLEIKTVGDLHIDMHHTVEDTGIVLGQAIKKALGDKKGIVRYASILLPMDETLSQAAIDISGRAYLVYPQPQLMDTRVGDFDVSLLKEFFEGFVNHSEVTLHLKQLEGNNAHHVLESLFKAAGQVLGQACRIDPRQTGIPSTKGVL